MQSEAKLFRNILEVKFPAGKLSQTEREILTAAGREFHQVLLLLKGT